MGLLGMLMVKAGIEGEGGGLGDREGGRKIALV